jgi:hypothetical protein
LRSWCCRPVRCCSAPGGGQPLVERGWLAQEPTWFTDQMMTTAWPKTSFTGTSPFAGSCWRSRRSADWLRWSPAAHSSPAATVARMLTAGGGVTAEDVGLVKTGPVDVHTAASAFNGVAPDTDDPLVEVAFAGRWRESWNTMKSPRCTPARWVTQLVNEQPTPDTAGASVQRWIHGADGMKNACTRNVLISSEITRALTRMPASSRRAIRGARRGSLQLMRRLTPQPRLGTARPLPIVVTQASLSHRWLHTPWLGETAGPT